MQRFLHARERASGGSNRHAGLVAIALAGSVLVAAGCASSSTSTSPSTASSRPFSPDASSFSGELPSSVASAKSSLLESASAAASAASAAASRAEASRSEAAASFEASVSAQLAAGRAEAQSVLSKTEGTGNALSDITLTGLPKAQTAGLNAALVTVVNSTSSTASYAIKVEFLDGDQVVDTTVLGIKDVASGAKATATAFSSLDRDKALVPRVAQAQRY
ncbi:hypothetical protein [Kitasatospora purpeofusca]|uniref:hypothetical protein n=1 Tax=Kitasatospora purpeofusca TaxID=67352 RepID=UPI00224E644A|nr:hypothetical protein [Kitasatospora purpeofusca]MCX4755586.1 hypothetical protein [Kitasatospora purpeofusca]WSR36547.1 hypothetical protein OG715_39685 [Kitasatospora purpeofusca]WSR44829.1 hypothetical protein OG196_40555 [Kitasatospora purpeofusca]